MPTTKFGSAGAESREGRLSAVQRVSRGAQAWICVKDTSRYDPTRAKEHQKKEKREHEYVGQLDIGIVSANRDDLTDDEGRNEATDHVSKSAEHADHENDRAERIADEWMHIILQ